MAWSHVQKNVLTEKQFAAWRELSVLIIVYIFSGKNAHKTYEITARRLKQEEEKGT